MSSNVEYVDFCASDTRILQELLKKAEYVTSRLKPLTGPLFHPSQAVLRRFMAVTMSGKIL